MSAEPSSNPFRRKGPPLSTNPTSDIYQVPPAPLHPETQGEAEVPKKIAKKVRVQSPPPLSPDTDPASLDKEERYSIPGRIPSPILGNNDSFDTMASESSEDELITSRPIGIPANPFSKTLETMENPGKLEPVLDPAQNVAASSKPSLDVDAFKRLLMTGNSGVEPPAPLVAPQVTTTYHVLGSGDSSTDTSSLSRNSIFENIQEPHPESPRTSHELEEPEDYRRSLVSATRIKPPPPSSRHGKMIKTELRDDPPLQSLPTPAPSHLQRHPPSLTDLNKPLPPAPRRSSHESDRESIFDKEAAGKTPEPPSPSSSIRRKAPPAPPLARRHSQMISDSKLTRSNSGRLSPKVEEDAAPIEIENTRSRSNSARSRSESFKAPPPPPSRRIGTTRGPLVQQPVASPLPNTLVNTNTTIPPPPPARGSSRSISGGSNSNSRPPSIRSIDITSPSLPASTSVSSPTPTSKRTSVLQPPPPPPHRHGRKGSSESTTTSRGPSGEYSRRSIDSIRRGSAGGSEDILPKAVEVDQETQSSRPDILAEMSKLQREIEEYRIQGGRRVT